MTEMPDSSQLCAFIMMTDVVPITVPGGSLCLFGEPVIDELCALESLTTNHIVEVRYAI